MKQSDRNKLYHHLKDEHFILTTDKDIDAILEIVNESTNDQFNSIIKKRLMLYRVINVVILSILVVLLPNFAIDYIMWIFISYNLIHVIYIAVKDKLNEIRILQKFRASRRNK